MKYTKSTSVQGEWIKKSELKTGMKAQLVSEAEPREGNFGSQDVAKIKVSGFDATYNVALNKTTIGGLIDAFGDDSKSWMGKNLEINIEKGIVAGKRTIMLYLVPEGFSLAEGSDGYMEILKDGIEVEKKPNATDDINNDLARASEDQKEM